MEVHRAIPLMDLKDALAVCQRYWPVVRLNLKWCNSYTAENSLPMSRRAREARGSVLSMLGSPKDYVAEAGGCGYVSVLWLTNTRSTVTTATRVSGQIIYEAASFRQEIEMNDFDENGRWTQWTSVHFQKKEIVDLQ
jgi:hypothetical protein